MCGIENMYLCNCIVRLMANSVLEEKNILNLFVHGFLFKEENVHFGFPSLFGCRSAGEAGGSILKTSI